MTKIEEAKRLLAVVKDRYDMRLRAREAHDLNDRMRTHLRETDSTVAERVEAENRSNTLFEAYCAAGTQLDAARKAYFEARHAAVGEWLATQGLPGNDGTWEQRAAREPWLYA